MNSQYSRPFPLIPAGPPVTLVLDNFPNNVTWLDIILADSEEEAWVRVDGTDPAVDGNNSILIRKGHGQVSVRVDSHPARENFAANSPDFPFGIIVSEATRVFVETRH